MKSAVAEKLKNQPNNEKPIELDITDLFPTNQGFSYKITEIEK